MQLRLLQKNKEEKDMIIAVAGPVEKQREFIS